jgi:hypothetical protein
VDSTSIKTPSNLGLLLRRKHTTHSDTISLTPHYRSHFLKNAIKEQARKLEIIAGDARTIVTVTALEPAA